MKSKFETVIGLEIHVQLNTKSKAFCRDSNLFGLAPNSQVGIVSLAHPGTLPYPNKEQVYSAIKLGLAIDSQINRVSTFDRKNYFYADLPKGYQITQDQTPVCVGGQIPIKVGDQTKLIQIHHIHMEEDAGKSIHDQNASHSLIDFNRAGTPLLEIVTEPDLRSGEEVDALMSAVRQLVRYLDISDGNMEQGSMRCDCNISIRPQGSTTLGNRCEVKNLNSMRFAKKAIQYEVKRQISLTQKGETIQQQTLNFNPTTGRTTPIRTKEDAHDYRYFPEPDMPPIVVSQKKIAALKAALPKLPWDYEQTFLSYGLSPKDSILLAQDLDLAEYYESFVSTYEQAIPFANLLINQIRPTLTGKINDYPISQEYLAQFLTLINDKTINKSLAIKQLLPNMLAQPSVSPKELVKAFLQEKDNNSN
ncbi:MAG TPA: Asp-tRNA(Asn)/Glu-tRNA(Gln) amidotransferase subunit GatB [Saprospiraceae bacterium]|nr:Asp-tRNA(Asn)/Glu-tRNA(Gln) amidotransferase subunit GatB [Saprospiraceae bacterium]